MTEPQNIELPILHQSKRDSQKSLASNELLKSKISLQEVEYKKLKDSYLTKVTNSSKEKILAESIKRHQSQDELKGLFQCEKRS